VKEARAVADESDTRAGSPNAASPAVGYAEAALYVALAFTARLMLDPALQDRSPLLFFTLPVLAAAARHGVGPGAFATLLGAGAGVWAFMGPHFSFGLLSVDEWANVGSFFATSAGIVYIAERLRRARAAEATTAEAAEETAAQLRGSEERYRAIVETAVDAIVVIDEAGTIRSFNPAAERIFGYAAADVEGQNVRVLMDDTHGKGHDGYIRAYKETSEAKIIGLGREVEGRRKDGSTFPLDLSIAEWRLGGERFFTGVMRDISDRKRAEAAVRESEDRLRRVLDQLFAFVGITELDGTLIEANRAPLEAAGIAAEDVIGKPFWEAYWWSYDAGVQARLKDAVARAAGGETVRYDVPIRVAGGELATIDFQIAPLRDAEGKITHLVPSAIPVEERVRARAELERRVAQLRSVYDGVPVGLAFHDRDLRFLEINDALAAINGLPVAAHVGRGVAEVLPETAADIVPIQRRVIETGEPLEGIEVRTRTAASGDERDYLVSYTPARDAAGEVVGLTVAVLDITDRKAAEEEVRRLNRDLEGLVEERTKRLEETVAELDAFAYTVSHDLRAPLRGIEGFARILNEDHADALGPTGQRYAKRIYAAAERMDQLIQDLLAYSRLSRADLELKRVDLGALVDATVQDHRAVIDAAGGRVTVERPFPDVTGNRAILGQIVANLLTNALKFVEEGKAPLVRIRAERQDDRVRLCVEDNGIGVDPEYRERIFNVFERLHGQEHYSGTGIGLAIVRKGAERLGGTAGVEPGPEGGSRFWVELPAADRGDER